MTSFMAAIAEMEDKAKVALDLQWQVAEFHRAFGQPVLDRPHVPSDQRVELRYRLMHEELREWVQALKPYSYDCCRGEFLMLCRDQRGWEFEQPDLPAVADALGDLLYVVMGTALEFGIDMKPILAAIHRANMAKLHDGKVVLDERGKVKKPEGWEPPDIAGELRKQGWSG